MKNFIYYILMLIISGFIVTINSAATHKHIKSTSKERPQDGVYSPRDAHHNENGEHHSEFDHEAIIGSVKEAEEYDSLTPEESKKRLNILIQKMDYNQDLYISRHELKSWIIRSFRKLAEEEAHDRYIEIDNDDNGKITWQEYFSNVYGNNDDDDSEETSTQSTSSEEQKMIDDDQIMFNGADLDHDGTLTPDEFILFQTPEEHPQMLPIVLNQTMQDKDHNQDGKIDFQEYIGDSAESHDKEWLITEKKKFDEDYDLNKDGVLTGNEVLTWVVPSNDEIATEEVDHLFGSTDTDHDNQLSYQEILDNYEIFVGSEATDYGDQLHNVQHFEDEL